MLNLTIYNKISFLIDVFNDFKEDFLALLKSKGEEKTSE